MLSGILGALVAQGLAPFRAALAGAFLHGRAGDVAGREGLIAGDLIEALPAVLLSVRAA